MTNPDNGRVVFDLLAKADSGNSEPLNSFVRRSTSWAVSADRACMLGLRQQFGALREGNWYPFSAQPESNPWPSTRSRHALALVRRDADGSRSWHELTLPTAVRIESVLAEGDTFPCQAFRHGDNAFGIQFHPEVTHAMMCKWTIRGAHRMELPGAKQRVAHFEDRWVYDYGMQTWLGNFLDYWLRGNARDKFTA